MDSLSPYGIKKIAKDEEQRQSQYSEKDLL